MKARNRQNKFLAQIAAEKPEGQIISGGMLRLPAGVKRSAAKGNLTDFIQYTVRDGRKQVASPRISIGG
jgi:hypothetical protein